MKPTEALIHQSKTIAKLMLEIAQLKSKYENLRELAISSIMKTNEILHEARKENEMLKKVLAG